MTRNARPCSHQLSMIGARMKRIIIQGILIVVGRQDTGELEAQPVLASRNRCDSLRAIFLA